MLLDTLEQFETLPWRGGGDCLEVAGAELDVRVASAQPEPGVSRASVRRYWPWRRDR
jgi:hypothetical protein